MKAVFSLILSLIIFTASFQNSLFIIDYKMNKAYYEIHCMNKDKPEMDCHGKCQMKMESEKSSNPISQVKYTLNLIFYLQNLWMLSLKKSNSFPLKVKSMAIGWKASLD